MGIYKKENLIQVTYKEFGETVNALLTKITEIQKTQNIKFNVIVPLLRSGAFPAFHIAAHLEIKNIIPAYFMYENGQIVKKFELPKLTSELPDNLHILLCDSCLTTGNTLKTALTELKDVYPSAKFYAAILWLEEGIEYIDGIEMIFFGKRTNEHKNSIDVNCINGLVVAPWEDFDIDWNEIKNY